MLSNNIRSLRDRLGYTQDQIGNYLGVSASVVNQYENDAKVIPAESISKIAILFNVEEHELYQENPQQQQILSVFAFDSKELAEEDLKSISAFKKIVLNYAHLSEALLNE